MIIGELEIKLRYDGEIEWEKSLGGANIDHANSISQISDGSYIVTGYTISNDGDVEENKGSYDYWTIKLDNVGEIIWKQNFGGSNIDMSNSVAIATHDNDALIIVGASGSSDGDVTNNKGGRDFWVVKLYPDEEPFIQADSSGLFEIVMPRITSKEVDMKTVEMGGFRDSVVVEFITNLELDFPVRIDSMYFEGANPDDFSFYTDAFPFKIPKGSAKDMYFRFQPTDIGYREANVVIITQADTLKYKIYGNSLQPELLVLEDVIDFGKVKLGDFRDTLQAVTIKNTGNSPMEILNTKHNLPNATDFITLAGGGNFNMQPGDTCKMDLRFTANEIGMTSGTLEFHYDGPGSPAIIQLIADVYANPIIESTQIDNPQLLCETYEIIDVPIYNGGDDNLEITDANITGANADEFFIYPEFSFKRIYVDNWDTLQVLFNPVSTGDKTAQLNLTNNSENAQNFVINLNARKDSSGVELNTQNILFEIKDEFISETKQIEIKNTGTTNLNWTEPVELNEFTLQSISPNPTPAGETSTADIVFAGASEGIYTETFTFVDNCDSTYSLNVKAEVGSEAKGNPIIETAQIDNPQLLCETYEIIDVPIYNSGDDNLEITDANITGANADEFFIYPEFSFKRIFVDNWDTLQVLFKPHSIGDKTAQLNLTNNSENAQNFVINLNARKDSSGIELNTQNILFEIKDEFISETKQIELKNTGTTDLNWTEPVQINEFTLQNITPNPTPAGETSTAYIVFAGASEGIYTETFTFKDECDGTATLNVRAEVVDASQANATLQILNLEGKPGDEVNAEIYFNKGDNLNIAGITGFSVTLTFNPTLLDPMDYNMEFIDEHTAKIRIDDIPLSGNAGDVLKNVRFKVGLGNTEECDLILSDAEVNGGNAQIDLINGKFKLLGVCYEGGTRLLNPYSEVGIQSISPNPAEGEIEIEISLIESGWTELSIYNTLGEKLETILSESIEDFGERTIKAKVSDYSSGLYFIVLKTPTVYQSKQVMIMR